MNRVVFNLLLAGERQGGEKNSSISHSLSLFLSVFPLSHFFFPPTLSQSFISFPAFPSLPTPTPLPSLLNLASVRPLKASTLSSSFLEATLAASTEIGKTVFTNRCESYESPNVLYIQQQTGREKCLHEQVTKVHFQVDSVLICGMQVTILNVLSFYCISFLFLKSSSQCFHHLQDLACFFSLFLFCTNT